MWEILRKLLRAGPPRNDRELGRAGERHAASLLKRAGYRIIERNVRVAAGEADIVCVDPDGVTIVMVEVKTRRQGTAGSAQGAGVAPEASVHAHKRKKLLAVMRSLSKANGWDGRPVRIDTIAVEWQEGGAGPIVRHHVNAVSG